jgi:Cu2+-containing amine oxidase
VSWNILENIKEIDWKEWKTAKYMVERKNLLILTILDYRKDGEERKI